MRIAVWCFAVLLSLPLFAQQKPAPSAAKPSAPELTAEGYRDLILKTSDEVRSLWPSTSKGFQPFGGMMYLVNDTEKTKSVAKAVAEHHKTWAEASVPKALQTSHAEIKSWIGQVQGNLEKAPALLQGGSLELVKYLSQFGNYEDLRKNPATALSGMDVTLTPIEKKAPEKKWSNCPSADNERPSLTAISVWATLGVESLEVSP